MSFFLRGLLIYIELIGVRSSCWRTEEGMRKENVRNHMLFCLIHRRKKGSSNSYCVVFTT